jgi:hypothetical protein
VVTDAAAVVCSLSTYGPRCGGSCRLLLLVPPFPRTPPTPSLPTYIGCCRLSVLLAGGHWNDLVRRDCSKSSSDAPLVAVSLGPGHVRPQRPGTIWNCPSVPPVHDTTALCRGVAIFSLALSTGRQACLRSADHDRVCAVGGDTISNGLFAAIVFVFFFAIHGICSSRLFYRSFCGCINNSEMK